MLGILNIFKVENSLLFPQLVMVPKKKVMDILGQSKILFSNAEIYAMPKFHQIYLYDLNANMLEINQEV